MSFKTFVTKRNFNPAEFNERVWSSSYTQQLKAILVAITEAKRKDPSSPSFLKAKNTIMTQLFFQSSTQASWEHCEAQDILELLNEFDWLDLTDVLKVGMVSSSVLRAQDYLNYYTIKSQVVLELFSRLPMNGGLTDRDKVNLIKAKIDLEDPDNYFAPESFKQKMKEYEDMTSEFQKPYYLEKLKTILQTLTEETLERKKKKMMELQNLIDPPPTKIYNTECAICFENILEDADAIELTRKCCHCGHAFHKKCLDQWLEKNDTCPSCRKKCLFESDIKNVASAALLKTFSVSVATFLIDSLQADPNITLQGKFPLLLASKRNDPDLGRLLISRGANTDKLLTLVDTYTRQLKYLEEDLPRAEKQALSATAEAKQLKVQLSAVNKHIKESKQNFRVKKIKYDEMEKVQKALESYKNDVLKANGALKLGRKLVAVELHKKDNFLEKLPGLRRKVRYPKDSEKYKRLNKKVANFESKLEKNEDRVNEAQFNLSNHNPLDARTGSKDKLETALRQAENNRDKGKGQLKDFQKSLDKIEEIFRRELQDCEREINKIDTKIAQKTALFVAYKSTISDKESALQRFTLNNRSVINNESQIRKALVAAESTVGRYLSEQQELEHKLQRQISIQNEPSLILGRIRTTKEEKSKLRGFIDSSSL
tara:strand:- start:982 stop:2946 length:1965 start_codon:yes stop_codon:yes gene_type:complete